jgi:hypothetical protein
MGKKGAKLKEHIKIKGIAYEHYHSYQLQGSYR